MEYTFSMKHSQMRPQSRPLWQLLIALVFLLSGAGSSFSAVVELNSTGGTTATNGLHFYIEDTTHLQVRRLNNTGQVYSPTAVPPSNNLDNGVFLRANGTVYGKNHTVTTFNPTMFNTFSISAVSPANPSSPGVQQIARNNLGINSGPQITIDWKYTTPLDFITAEVTVTIPPGYAVSAANPVRYFHVFDTYLGGDDAGCGVRFTDSNNKLVVGTYSKAATGTACPSSSVVSGSVVETFRERSGLPFSSYCAAGWSTFFINGAVNCSVLQSMPLSNTIVTSYQDTGIGIAYDFTAAGTYTFSYDFVIGTTVVPAYDHIEIVHDGSATLCPETLQVKACTSSVVPCPIANLVNTGTITGQLFEVPASAGVSVNPTSFSVGSAGTTASVILQATAAGAGTYTLTVNNISGTPPLNGTKCWNGSSSSCTIVISNTPCVEGFECIETSKTYNNLTSTPSARNPLHTKLAGSNFKFDIVALQALGVQSTAYTATGNVVVELFDDSATPRPACNAYSSPVASQAITFAATDLGRKTLPANFNLPNTYSKLMCRVRDSNLTPNVYGCSSDGFSVRPVAPILSTNASTLPPSASSGVGIKAGAAFTVAATTTPVAGYAGSLLQDVSKLTAQKPNSAVVADGGVVGNLFAAATITNLALSTNQGPPNNNASYSEVGYLYAAPGAFRDDAMTNIDLLPTGCAATNTCDCITATASGANLSDALDVATNRYGCSVGNKTTVSFGRFIPDHFTVTAPSLTAACIATLPGTSFSYFGQDGFGTAFTLTAKNTLNNTTQNYVDLFAKLTPGTYSNYGFAAGSLPAGAILTSSATTPTGVWANGVANILAKHQISRPTALTGQTLIALSAAPTDGEVPATGTSALGTATMRYGRLRMQNAFGSELLDLPMSVIAQYWNGSGWVQNMDDSCTGIVAPTAAAGLTFASEVAANIKGNHLSAGETAASVSSAGKLFAGDARLKFSKPGAGNNGYVDVTLATPVWLQFPWKSLTNSTPTARATFGIYKNVNEFIYMREMH